VGEKEENSGGGIGSQTKTSQTRKELMSKYFENTKAENEIDSCRSKSRL
jgi:hypothetical protein